MRYRQSGSGVAPACRRLSGGRPRPPRESCKAFARNRQRPEYKKIQVGGTPASAESDGRLRATFPRPVVLLCFRASRQCYFDTFLGDLLVSVLSNSFADGGGGTALLNTMALALTSLP
jgi:hypothetical protein